MRYYSRNRYLTIDGETKTLREFSQESGVPENLIHWRIKKLGPNPSAEDVELAVYTKPRKYAKRKAGEK